MQKLFRLAAALCLGFGGLSTCGKPPADTTQQRPTEHIDEEQKAAAAKLQPFKDPVQEAIYAYRMQVRQDYNARRFDALEAQAAAVRASKEVFGNGAWKLVQYYEAFGCRRDEPESMWQLHDQIHHDWIAAKPESAAARIAYVDYLVDYAWKARGNGYANTVTDEGWKLYEERLTSAQKVLQDARGLAEKDLGWWRGALRVALGVGLPKNGYDRLVAEAVAFEPKYWGYDTLRAYSLLPRWYGQQGDWEAYADAAAKRSDGLGAEVYARIVADLHDYYDNVFRETQASWLLTRDGLAQMRAKYPDSLSILSVSAKLAVQAEDRALAQKLFEQIGDRYLPDTWHTPERFVHYRHWVQTGTW